MMMTMMMTTTTTAATTTTTTTMISSVVFIFWFFINLLVFGSFSLLSIISVLFVFHSSTQFASLSIYRCCFRFSIIVVAHSLLSWLPLHHHVLLYIGFINYLRWRCCLLFFCILCVCFPISCVFRFSLVVIGFFVYVCLYVLVFNILIWFYIIFCLIYVYIVFYCLTLYYLFSLILLLIYLS